jgi:hypothetical protein
MSRFIAQLLIVSLITLNIAWAVDECTFSESGREIGALLHIDEQSPDAPNAGLDCDDWCHARVSPAAMMGSCVQNVAITATISGGSYTFSYSSLSIPPPYRPPIA